MTSVDRLAPQLLERVLGSLGFAATPAIDLAGLAALYQAWCRKVPFDNLRKRIHLHRGLKCAFPGDTPEDFFDAWLRFRTGGTCWAGNGALCSLLSSIGFEAERGIATMLARPDIPPNHGTVLVNLSGERYVVDASILYAEPLRLDEHIETAIEHGAWGVKATKREGAWHIRWRPLHAANGMDCRIDRLSATAAEFSERHEATRPWGGFNFEIHARINRGSSVIGTCTGKRVEFQAQGSVIERKLDRWEQMRMLIEEFGIAEEFVAQLPADTPTPPPPGSHTARKTELKS